MRGRLIFLDRIRYDLRDNGAFISILGCSLWTKVREDQVQYIYNYQSNHLENVPGILFLSTMADSKGILNG